MPRSRWVGYAHYELTIVLGDDQCRGTGIGRDATGQVIRMLFEKSETERIQAQTLENNEEATKMCKHLGFKEEGILRNAFRLEGEHVNMRLMGLLKN